MILLNQHNAYKEESIKKSMEREGVVLTRKEIEAKLATVGDYVKMDYLQQCLKKSIDFDTRKFILNKLSATYEARNMFLEAGKLSRAAADINVTYESKMQEFIKSTVLFIKAGAFDEADVSVGKALVCATERQKPEIKNKIKEAYKVQAKDFIKKDKRKNAMYTYEKLLSLELNSMEKKEVQQSLLPLYEKLGKVKEYLQLSKIIQA